MELIAQVVVNHCESICRSQFDDNIFWLSWKFDVGNQWRRNEKQQFSNDSNFSIEIRNTNTQRVIWDNTTARSDCEWCRFGWGNIFKPKNNT